MGTLRDILGTLAGSFSIGKESASVASAALEVESTSQGILIPRLTTAQMNAITSPEDWLEVVNTTMGMRFIYDGNRSKWLSIEGYSTGGGRNGNTLAGNFYRGFNGMVFDGTNLGMPVPKGTLVGLGWTRNDADAATLEVLVNGTSITTLASSAAGLTSNWNTDVNFDAGLMSFRNQAGGNTTTDVQITALYRRRA